LGLDASGKVVSASLTGTGHINKGDFKFTVTPLFTKPLEVLQVESQPLRILVNASYEQTKHLAGSITRLNKPMLIRPFVLRVNKSEAAGQSSWLSLDASSNIHNYFFAKSMLACKTGKHDCVYYQPLYTRQPTK